ncbi:MAG: undecaprenyl/decaprenyl-phosphate alpha-N-acetylglucosaminyl 1-phosphate transferase [Planctomycetes bacterium]|nr:undecaprenyl/decaprenyl-phosphate alpha-N-acetylglucosaminyl 1-phosphate transferase [Planctomycetota bacterium]
MAVKNKMQNGMTAMMIFDDIIGPARPITWVLRFWPVLLAAFAGSLAATFLCKKIALKFGIVDKPDATVKTHKKPVAYLGGVGILIGLTVGVLAGIACLGSEGFSAAAIKWLLGILAGAAVACFVGLADDIFDIKPLQKILGCCLAAVVLLLAGVVPNLNFISGILNLQLPGSIEKLLEVFIVVFFVLGATNSLNLLDGLDGLCAGVTAIITLAMLLLSVHLATWGFSETGDPVRIIICCGLVGSVFGFLPFNRHPAKIFMGDAGSMLLGFTIAAIMILFAEFIPRWWMASIIVFGLPILDTAVAMVRRLLNHRPLFVSDRGHIYDQMLDRGMSLKKTVAICYVLAGTYAAIGVVMSQIRTKYAAVVYVLVFLVSAFVIWKKGYLKMEGFRGAIHK